MKSYNITYTNDKDLENFIYNNEELINSKSILIQIFSGVLNKNILLNISNIILDIIPNANIIGATTDGEIIDNIVNTNTIILSFTTFEKTNIKSAIIQSNDIYESYDAGIKIATSLKENNTKAMILFADGLHINGEELLNGVSKISHDIIIAGGLSGDNATFTGTYIIYQNRILQKGIVGVSLNSDDLIVTNGYNFAWKTIGKKFVVNKSIKNIVYEIDGMTPTQLYEKYLGKEVSQLLPGIGIEFPLIIQDDNMQIARAVLSTNEDGSLIFAGNIKEGSIVKFGVGDINSLISGSIELSKKIIETPSESIFIYSCMARRHFLDSNASNDIKYFSKIATVSGFFTYGEFYTKESNTKLLNESLTILSLSENKKINNISIDNIKKPSSFATLQALSHLINVSSRELEKLNDNLEERIQIEINKNHETQKKLFNSIKMTSLGDMISNIAHQWRQPLSIISTIASGIQMQKELGTLDENNVYNKMSKIIDKSKYLSNTIDTFRDFIQEDYVVTKINLTKEITKTLTIVESILNENDITLINNINYTQEININIISGELSQVIINIFNNAKDALILNNIKDKKIFLDLFTTDEHIIISIEDNAGGIPEDILPKIFEPYFTTKHKNTGTGIGLYMCYDIITKHFAGNLYAKNTTNGAKFCIQLPINK